MPSRCLLDTLGFALWLLLSSEPIMAARFDHYVFPPQTPGAGFPVPNSNTPVVTIGPPNPPAQVSPIFGLPNWRTCLHIMLHEMPTNGDDPLQGRVSSVVTDFVGPGAEFLSVLPSVRVPKVWTLSSRDMLIGGDCRISLMTMSGPGVYNRDSATYVDIFHALGQIKLASQRTTIGWNGGMQVFGEHNNLVIFIYGQDSVFGETFNHQAGCVRQGDDAAFLDHLGFFARPCTDEEEAQSPAPTNHNGPDSGLYSMDTACATANLKAADVMYGLKMMAGKASSAIIRLCQATIMDIEISAPK